MYITGYSIKAPNSNNISEFIKKLYDNINLSDKSKRYPKKYNDLPEFAGHLNNLEYFDNVFFKFNKKSLSGLDIQTRLLLEVTYEALLDANISIDEINN